MLATLKGEAIYLWAYFDIQLRQIFGYWVLGMALGSLVSVFARDWLHETAERAGGRFPRWLGLPVASLLGIASPLCMYGTIPLCAAFSRKGLREDFLAAFMTSSILLNPQLILYSSALGWFLLATRVVATFLCGVAAGALVRVFYTARGRNFFSFGGFAPAASRDVAPAWPKRLLFNLGRNLRATGPWFLLGVLLSALFQRYVPPESVGRFLGKGSQGFGVLMAAAMGVPLYVCGGGTIPLILQALAEGMSPGAAAAFMITGPATKITNLGALKIVLGARHFALYLTLHPGLFPAPGRGGESSPLLLGRPAPPSREESGGGREKSTPSRRKT
ncbi:MAG: permease [Oligosphaeraceae bacterium]